MNEFLYKVNDTEYLVKITYKRIRNIYFRFIDGVFYVSCSRFTSKKSIVKGLDKYASRMIKKNIDYQENKENKIYLFGEKYDDLDSGEFTLIDGTSFTYKSKEDRTKKIEKLFKEYVNLSLEKYAKMMGVTYSKVSFKHAKTRYGSYSKRTGNINISYSLIPYSKEIIDSVLIHELSHIKVFNHSKQFYEVVYSYCLNYDVYSKKLKRGELK